MPEGWGREKWPFTWTLWECKNSGSICDVVLTIWNWFKTLFATFFSSIPEGCIPPWWNYICGLLRNASGWSTTYQSKILPRNCCLAVSPTLSYLCVGTQFSSFHILLSSTAEKGCLLLFPRAIQQNSLREELKSSVSPLTDTGMF